MNFDSEWLIQPAGPQRYSLQTSEGKYLAPQDGELKISDEMFGWMFKDVEHANSAKPATSCHFSYQPELPDHCNRHSEWSAECSVVVEASADCTYFCMVGWGPGVANNMVFSFFYFFHK